MSIVGWGVTEFWSASAKEPRRPAEYLQVAQGIEKSWQDCRQAKAHEMEWRGSADGDGLGKHDGHWVTKAA